MIRTLALVGFSCLMTMSSWAMPPDEGLFLRETFETEPTIVEGRTGQDSAWLTFSTNGKKSWNWAQGGQACNGEGYMVAPPAQDCSPSWLASPMLEIPGAIDTLQITFSRRFLNGIATKAADLIQILTEDGTITTLATLPRSKKLSEDCETVTVTVTGFDRRFRLILAAPDNCSGLILDQVLVRSLSLNVSIVEPSENPFSAIKKTAYPFRAEVGETVEDVEYKWAVRSTQAAAETAFYTGQNPQITFAETGNYEVFCIAKSASRISLAPAMIMVKVSSLVASMTEPDVQRRQPYLVNLGATVPFEAKLEDPNNQAREILWLRGKETVCREVPNSSKSTVTSQCQIPFTEKGMTGVTFQVRDAAGETLFEETQLIGVGIDLKAVIQSPQAGAELRSGGTLELRGLVFGTYASDPNTQVGWVYEGKTYEGLNVSIPLTGDGRRQARFVVTNAGHQVGDSAFVNFHVVDPNHEVRPKIIQPASNWWVPVGEHLYFEASIGDAPASQLSLYWKIYPIETSTYPAGATTFASDSILAEGNSRVLGNVTFPTAGSYNVDLYFRGEGEDRLVDQRKIVVQERGAMVGGDGPAAPVNIWNGKYSGLNLDKDHYYKVNVPSDGRTVQLELDFPDGAAVVFYPKDGEQPLTRCVQGQHVLNLNGLKAGDYTWGVLANSSCATASKKSSFSFNISVLAPALFFSDVAENKDFTTEIGIVNTTGELAEISLIGYDNDGSILAEVGQEIEAMGTFKDQVSNIFGEVATQITWIQVSSTHELTGYSRTLSLDRMESYAVSAAKLLQSQLFIPHIAEDTGTWYTKANLINGKDLTIDPVISAQGTSEQPLNNKSSFSRDQVTYKAETSTLEAPPSWATFLDQHGTASLAGNEIFGTVNGTRQVVGLGLAGPARDNPNFTTSSNTLYFTHLANPAKYWTGLALLNRGDAPQGALITAYASDGTPIGTGTVVLGAFERRVALAEVFLAEAQINITGAEWLEVQADDNLSGYELFGSLSDGHRLAGIESVSLPQSNLCMPFVDSSGETYHGLAIVNVAATSANITLTLRSETGEALMCVEDRTMAAKQKQIFVLAELFPEMPANAGWIEVNGIGSDGSESQLVGFELFGDHTNNHMSGLVAQ